MGLGFSTPLEADYNAFSFYVEVCFLKVRPGLQVERLSPQINCHAWKTELGNSFLCFLLCYQMIIFIINCYQVTFVCVFLFFFFFFLPGSTRPAQEIFAMHVCFWWKGGKNCQQDPKKTGIMLVDYLFLPYSKANLSSALVLPGDGKVGEWGTGKVWGVAVSPTLSAQPQHL